MNKSLLLLAIAVAFFGNVIAMEKPLQKNFLFKYFPGKVGVTQGELVQQIQVLPCNELSNYTQAVAEEFHKKIYNKNLTGQEQKKNLQQQIYTQQVFIDFLIARVQEHETGNKK